MLDLLTAPLAAAMLLQAPVPFEAGPFEEGVDLAATAGSHGAPPQSVLDLGTRPEARLGETQRVAAQFCREVETWSPFLSRFDPATFRGFEVWADEQLLWVEEEFDAPQARLFVRRGSAAALALAGARPHDRYQLELVVREIHAGRPWIEVTAARWTREQTPQGTVLHAIRALELMERDGWTLAVGQFERALAPDLPPHVRAELERLKAECEATIAALLAN